MGNKKIMMLVGSILLGALAGFALLGYVRGVRDEVLDDVSRVPVWVVSGPIAEGTTASSAEQLGLLTMSEIESSFVPGNAITTLDQIAGQIAASDLVENQIVLAGSFDDPGVVQTTFADQLPSDHVAFSIAVPRQRAVNGAVKPGDFVDIIVLGDPPVQAGEGDVFENSLQASPYQQPARTLFRGVRIEGIDDELVGEVPDENQVPVDEEEAQSLNLTLSMPSSAAQRLLSVDPADIVLALLPPDWELTQQDNEVVEAIIVNEDLPGENPQFITPYGVDGFVDPLDQNTEGDEVDGVADPALQTESVPESDPIEEVEADDLFPDEELEADDIDEEEGQ